MRVIDNGNVNMGMDNPYEAVLGSSGGVTWSMSAVLIFDTTEFAPEPLPPSGTTRDVAWTVSATLIFDTTELIPEPSPLLSLLLGIPFVALLARARRRRDRAIDSSQRNAA
jgi:hypothetical protein